MRTINRTIKWSAVLVIIVLAYISISLKVHSQDQPTTIAKTMKVFTATVPVPLSQIKAPALMSVGKMDVSAYSKIRIEARLTGTQEKNVAGELRLNRPITGCDACTVETINLSAKLNSRVLDLPARNCRCQLSLS